MFELRDLGWALALAFCLHAVVQWRPMATVRRKVEREANEAFLTSYSGRRYLNGDIILAPGSGGVRTRDLEAPVLARRFEILHDEISWDGSEAELLVRHVLREADGSTSGRDLSRDVHVKLERKGGRWRYTHCEVRGHGVVTVDDDTVPWELALVEHPGGG